MTAVPRLLSLFIFLISSMMGWYHYFAGNPFIVFIIICLITLIQIKLCYGDDYE